MSYRLKLTLSVLAFKVIGFAEEYLIPGLGLEWLLPILFAAAVGAVLGTPWWMN